MLKGFLLLLLLINCQNEQPVLPKYLNVIAVALDGIREHEIIKFPIESPGLKVGFYGTESDCRSSHRSRISLPTYYTFLTGRRHPNLDVNYLYEPVAHNTLLDKYDSQAISSWEPLRGIAGKKHTSKKNFHIVDAPRRKTDPVVFERYQQLAKILPFTFIHFTDADEAAHDGSWKGYLAKVEEEIKYVGDIIKLHEYIAPKRQVYVVFTDHGRGRGLLWKYHGRPYPGSSEIWAYIVGPNEDAISLEDCTHISLNRKINQLLSTPVE